MQQQQQHATVQLTAVQDRLDVTLVTLDMLRTVCPASVYDSSTCALDLHLRCSGQPDQLVPAFIDDLEGVARVRWRPEGGMVCTGRPLLNQQPVASWSNLPPLFVTVMPAPADVTGFATVADNKQYFKDRTTGHLVFPVGMNLAWPGGTNSTKPFYSAALPALAAAKANYARLWFGPSQAGYAPFSDIQLQRSLGKVDPQAAANVDWLLDECESLGFRALVSLESFNALCTNKKYFCSWGVSVYNKQNGGPLSQADDFWASEPAHAAFRDYTRQVVARWGASTSVLSWQLFNEMDGALGGVSAAATQWLSNITAYIAAIDTHGHMITNSYAQQSGMPQDDKLANISYTTTHAYEGGDLGGDLAHYSAIKSSYGKPTYSGEFGRNAPPRLTGLILHNGMWGTIAQLGAASGACWWWQTAFGDHLLDEFTAIATFVHDGLGDRLSDATKWQLLEVQGVPSQARLFAQSDNTWSTVVGYLQNKEHIFGNNPPYNNVNPFQAQLQGCPGSTSWSLAWYNTTSGTAMGSPSKITCSGGTATVTTPTFSTDRAFIMTSS